MLARELSGLVVFSSVVLADSIATMIDVINPFCTSLVRRFALAL
jgi:divalent metal cation (Fe/Co/Zn/Cd) transporter